MWDTISTRFRWGDCYEPRLLIPISKTPNNPTNPKSGKSRVQQMSIYANQRRHNTQHAILHVSIFSILFLILFCGGTVSAQQIGGDLRYGELTSQMSKYDPIHGTTSLAYRIGVMVFNGLLSFDLDNEPVPQLTSMTQEELQTYQPINAIIYEFPLRRDIQWHDGTPFSAYDVLFTYYAMKNSPQTKEQVDFIADARVQNEYLIEFTLAAPILNALGRLAFPIIPHHPFVPNRDEIRSDNPDCKVPEFSDFVVKPIGTGPYHFDLKGNEVHLFVNENYPLLRDGRTRSYIDKIIMRPFPNEVALAGAMSFSGVDLAVEIPSTLVESTIQQAEGAGRQLWKERYQSLSYYFFALNHNHPFLGGEENQPVRQAIHYATNRQQWLEAIENSSGVLVSGPFPHDSPFVDASVQPYEYNVEKAMSLLADAGFSDTDGDGILDKGGEPFKLTLKLVAGSLKDDQIAQAFIADLYDIGIMVGKQTITTREEWTQQVMFDHNFDLVLDYWSFSAGAGLYPLFYSTQSFPGGKNYISYNSFVVDNTLDIFREELDPAVQQTLGRELHRVLHQDCPYIFLWTPFRTAVGDMKIRNVQIHPDGFFDYITEWWLEY
jgi:peptide/nickel transport system substrate-binding protein